MENNGLNLVEHLRRSAATESRQPPRHPAGGGGKWGSLRPSLNGAWLSLVEHLNGVQGVASSNLAAPIFQGDRRVQGVASSNLAAPIIVPPLAARLERKRESEGEIVSLGALPLYVGEKGSSGENSGCPPMERAAASDSSYRAAPIFQGSRSWLNVCRR